MIDYIKTAYATCKIHFLTQTFAGAMCFVFTRDNGVNFYSPMLLLGGQYLDI